MRPTIDQPGRRPTARERTCCWSTRSLTRKSVISSTRISTNRYPAGVRDTSVDTSDCWRDRGPWVGDGRACGRTADGRLIEISAAVNPISRARVEVNNARPRILYPLNRVYSKNTELVLLFDDAFILQR